MKMRRFIGVFVVLAASLVLMVPAGADVSPPEIDATVPPGSSITVDKTVTTPEIPPNPDIVFFADTTGSMGPAIDNVEANATSIMNTVVAAQPTAQFGVSEYRDEGDVLPVGGYFGINQPVTNDITAAQTAISGWTVGGGGDTPEGQIPALYELATNGAVGFRTGSTRIAVWFGDSSGHDPRAGSRSHRCHCCSRRQWRQGDSDSG